jgi:DNA repair exonuclease SbcCD ATPase subunit
MIKKVIFEKLEIQNFLSIGEEKVTVQFQNGISIVTGINRDQLDRRNGIGKSTIADALSFVLFGTTIRDLKKEFITNNITNNTAEITLTFSVTVGSNIKKYHLYRSIDPSKCLLYEDDIDITRDSMINTTSLLQDILNITPEIFQNCVVMAVNSTVPFMAKKKIEKRKFIESIFNLEVFSQMNSLLKDDYAETKRSFDVVSGKYDELKTLLEKISEQINNKDREESERKNRLHRRKEDCLKQKSEIDEKLSKLKDVNLSDVQTKLKELKVTDTRLVEEINNQIKKITSIETKNEMVLLNLSKIGTTEDVCPVCLREIKDNDKTHIHDKKRNLKKEIESNTTVVKLEEQVLGEIEAKKQKVVSGIKSLENIIQKQKLQAQQRDHFQNNAKEVETRLQQIENDINEAVVNDNSLKNIYDQTKDKLTGFEGQFLKDRDLLNTLDTVKFVISEEGVKSFIVKKILKLFNSKLGYYLRKLNSTAIITFNEYFEETIVNNKGRLTCYDNYSGAEKKVIDLAIMFTFLEMLRLQGNVFYNIQLYDELLDTSLDEAGVEMVLKILKEFIAPGDLGIYIISHRKECAKISTGDVVYLEKTNGITRRVKAIVE